MATLSQELARLGNQANQLLCASDRPCALPHELQEHLSEQLELQRRATALPQGAVAGMCAQTIHEGNCNQGTKGYWPARRHNITSLRDCANRCRHCRRCRFVSFSRAKAHDDCSWYSECDVARLLPPPATGIDYMTLRVDLAGAYRR